MGYENTEQFHSNIIYSSKPLGNFTFYVLLGFGNPSLVDSNLFFSSPTDIYQVVRYNEVINLETWQSMGFDIHSLFGEDPQFIDPKNGNYTVSPNSPAFKIGFQNFVYGPQQSSSQSENFN